MNVAAGQYGLVYLVTVQAGMVLLVLPKCNAP